MEVLGPSSPDELEERCHSIQVPYEGVRARDRREYLVRLAARLSRQRRRGSLLWCNGALPALAALGAPGPTVVHLHQSQSRLQMATINRVRGRALATVVPSLDMAGQVPGSRTMCNWTSSLAVTRRTDRPIRRVGFIGRLSPAKGLDTLAEAVAVLRQKGLSPDLVVAGDYRFVARHEASKIEAALSPLGPELLGWVPSGDFFGIVDACVVPSRWREPFGLVAAEAMAHGVPCLVSDRGALPEVVGPAHPYVFKGGNAASLAEVLEEMLSASPDVLGEVTRRARSRWESTYSPQVGEGRFVELVEELTSPQ